jgi:hypothetical protein
MTTGFGAPDTYGTHVFKVVIPAERGGTVKIFEHFGYAAHGSTVEELRVEVPRQAWTVISDIARREFNSRLRKMKLPAARWQVGENTVDRVLGRELCVLAWAAEKADRTVAQTIVTKWSALQPEERWWLYSITNAEAGLAGDSDRGWRLALRAALSDGTAPRPRPKHLAHNTDTPSLFEVTP